jgi:hypothetical protein
MTESTKKADTVIVMTGLPGEPPVVPQEGSPELWTRALAVQEAERAIELREEAQKRAREMPPDVRNTKDGRPVPFVPANN